jgi:hypothetical protein
MCTHGLHQSRVAVSVAAVPGTQQPLRKTVSKQERRKSEVSPFSQSLIQPGSPSWVCILTPGLELIPEDPLLES